MFGPLVDKFTKPFTDIPIIGDTLKPVVNPLKDVAGAADDIVATVESVPLAGDVVKPFTDSVRKSIDNL